MRTHLRLGAGAVATAMRTLAILAVASYLVIDVVYSALGVISPIYLMDATVEIAFVAGHIVTRPRESDARSG